MLYRRVLQIVTCLLLSVTHTFAAEPGNCDSEVPSIHCGQAPSAQFDAEGRLWVVFAWQQYAWVAYSDDLGESFATPVRVNSHPENIEVNGENRPKIVLDETHDVIYVSWTQKTEGAFTGDIRFTRSLDGGKSFETVRTINDDQLLTSHRFESLFLSDSGNLFITWLDKRELEYAAQRGEQYTGSAVFYTVSDDQGESFAANRKISDHSCECCRIAVAPYGDDGMTLLWRQIFDDTTRDHAIGVVTAGGQTPLQVNRASVDDWQIEACPHHGPALLQAQGSEDSYHLSWFSAGNLHKGIYYGRHALEDGTTRLVTQVDGSPGAGHPQLAEEGDTLYLVWKRFDGRATVLLMQYSLDQGETWSDEQILMSTQNASDHPLLINGPDGVFVSWMTTEHGYQVLALPEPEAKPESEFEEVADIRPFTAETLADLKAERAGQPFLLALWSVDCPPCMAELNMLGNLRQEHPDLPLVLVSTDQIEHRADAEDFLIEYELDAMPSWMFADPFAERLRFTIDPQWFGELPRSYFFNAQHQPQAHSGILTEDLARQWLDL